MRKKITFNSHDEAKKNHVYLMWDGLVTRKYKTLWDALEKHDIVCYKVKNDKNRYFDTGDLLFIRDVAADLGIGLKSN
jgi:hypothetical protein